MDLNTIHAVCRKHRPHFFAPLGNKHHLESFGIPASQAHVLDWWEESAISVSLPSSGTPSTTSANGARVSFVLTCAPAQHTANRTPFDRWRTLWASWAVSEDLPSSTPSRAPKTVYFGGDTGYKTVFAGEDEETLPRCPAFAEVGEKFGKVDLALLPIGCVMHPECGPMWVLGIEFVLTDVLQGVRATYDVVWAARVARRCGADLQGRACGAGDRHALGVSSLRCGSLSGFRCTGWRRTISPRPTPPAPPCSSTMSCMC